jgi:heat shock protein HslJ
MSLSAEDLAGTTYLSTGSEGRDLVEETQVSLSFPDGRMAVHAGCNQMSGPYDVTEGRLAWTAGPMTTRMAGPEDRMQQDRWLTELLSTGVDVGLDGDAMTLSSGEVTLHLVRRPATEE